MADLQFPEALFERLRAGNCVLCSGVRFSAAAGMPSWDELFVRLSAKLGAEGDAINQLLKEGKGLTVAGFLKRKLGQETCTSLLKEVYSPKKELPTAHKLLKDIPFRAAICTGYDSLVQQVVAPNGSSARVFTYADGAVLRLSEDLQQYVVKAHGDLSKRSSLVLDRLDFKRAIGPNQAYRAFMEDLYRTNTLLIVGYHLSDPDLVLLLERLVSSFRDAVTDHYALLSGVSGPEAEELYANYRIRVIPYEEGADQVGALEAALTALRDQWRSQGAQLPGPEDPEQQRQWLRQQLAPVETRIDVLATEGLELSDARLDAIRSAAASVPLAELDPETLCRLGNVSLTFGDTSRARECYQAALAQNAKLADAHLNLHHAHAEEKNFDEALAHLKRAGEIEPSFRVVPERYELTGVIGRGTTGTIYKAQDSKEKREVTVKVLRTRYVREHVSPQRWLKETEQLKKLDHPNLARVHEALLEEGRCILVTEHLKGKSLSALLRQEGPLSPERAVEILQPVCAGLAHAHQQGSYHLDLTPSNIFLREDGTVAVMDFRTGRAHKGRYITERAAEGYQAPEIIAGEGGDARADVYSLGAILYKMLTRKQPVGSFPRLAELSPAARRFDALVNRALRAVAEERPQSVEEFAKVLASTTEEITLPEREDDLEGWLEVQIQRPDHPQAQQVLRDLERGYRKDKDWPQLVTLLLGRVEFELEGEIRERLLREVGQILEREMGDPGKAFAALQAAFRENSASVEIRKELERLAGVTGMWNELLQEYTQLVQSLREPKLACDWWVRMGQLYANKLGHDDYALASFNQALALDANRADALAEVVEVQRRKGLLAELTQTLGRLVELEEDPLRKVEVLKDLAQLHASAGDSENEAAAYRRVLELDPTNAAAAAALESLLRQAERWEELASLLEGLIEKSEVADELRCYRHQLAGVLADQLERPKEAIAQYQQLMAEDAGDMAALKGLERLYDATGRTAEYLEILDRLIAAADKEEERLQLCQRMATEWEAQEGGKAKAAEYLEKAIALGRGTEEIYRDLVRLYWDVKDYPKLVNAYQQHIALSRDENKTGLFAALGKVYEDHLEAPDKALQAFDSLLALDPENKIALAAQARLHQKAGNYPQAAEALERLATKEQSVDQQVEIYHQLGVIQHEQLKQPDQAEVSLVKALELTGSHVPTLLSLAKLYRQRKDFGKAARMLREAAQQSANQLERAKHLYAAATTFQDELDDAGKAQEVYEELLALDPEHVLGGERLASLYEKQKRWPEAQPLLEMLVRKADPRERGRLLELNLRLGDAALENENKERALTALRAAHEVDPTAQPVLLRLANLLYEREAYEEAGKLLQSLLVHRRDAMEPAEIVDVFYKLGMVKERGGEPQKALNMLEKALDVAPDDRRVLELAIRLYEAKGDFEAVLRCKRALLKGADEEQLLLLLEEIGDLLHERLKRPDEAITAYRKAVDLKPDHRRVLNKIMELYIIQKKWTEAISAMGKIEDYETDPAHRARMHYTAAVIYRDELNKLEDSAWHFDQALVKDPSHRKAFEALKAIYSRQKNYKGLVKAYRLMLQRLPETTPKEEQVQLWQELGEICQDKLQDYLGAIVAFEVAAKLDPKNEQRQENLALLYTAAGPDAYDKAVRAHQRLLQNNPLRLEAYKELRRLYGEMGQQDKEWCVTAVLALLKKASTEELALYQQRRSERPRRLARKLSDDLWRDHLYHAKQTPALSNLYSIVAPVISPMAVRTHKDWQLRESECLDLAHDPRPYAKVLHYVQEVLNQTPAEAYLRGDLKEQAGLVLAGGQGELAAPVLLLNPALVKNDSERELAYWLTKTLCLLRAEHMLCFATPSPTVLRAVALASLKLVRPDTKLSGDVESITRLTEALKAELLPSHVDALAEEADAVREASSEEQIAAWMQAVSLSATRAALVVCDDLETAARLVSIESAATGGKDTKQRLQQLMLYAVSEPYFQLRELLGLQLK